MNSRWSHFTIHHFINNPSISKCTSSHHFIIPSSSTISIEIFNTHIPILQVKGSWTIQCYFTSWRYMVSSNRITKHSQTVSILNILDLLSIFLHLFKERRIIDISILIFPIIEKTLFNL